MARFRDLYKSFRKCMRHRRAFASFEGLAKNAPVAQLDRALDYESRGQEFESLRARQHPFGMTSFYPLERTMTLRMLLERSCSRMFCSQERLAD
jgi:hypothetical protein